MGFSTGSQKDFSMQGWLKAAVEWWKGEEPEAPLPEKAKWFETAAWWLRDRERQVPVTVRAAALDEPEKMELSEDLEVIEIPARPMLDGEFAERCARVEQLLKKLEQGA